MIRWVGPVLLMFAISGVTSTQADERTAATVTVRGKVLRATRKRAYLSAGFSAGLAVGQTVKIVGPGGQNSMCKIDAVADSTATCMGERLMAGSHFVAKVEKPTAPVPNVLSPPTPSSKFESTLDVLEEITYGKVDEGAHAAHGGPRMGLASISAGHEAWATLIGPSALFQAERVRMSIHGAPIGFGGFRAYAEIEALRWYTSRPSNARFPSDGQARFYAWEAALSSREIGRPYTLSLGRIWPWNAPGLTTLDGVQAGWRSRDGSLETGGYFGGIPNMLTLEPSFERWALGGYLAQVHSGEKQSFLRLARQEGRIGMRKAPVGSKAELEWLGQMWLGSWLDVGTEFRASLGSSWQGPRFEALRSHFSARASDRVRLFGGFRYLARRSVDEDGLGLSPYGAGGFYASDFDIAWIVRAGLTLSLDLGTVKELESPNGRSYVGPDVGFPRLFGAKGGMLVGYREEWGWLAGRTVHAQVMLNPIEHLRLQSRLSYFEDRAGSAASTATWREVGLTVFADSRISRVFYLRASTMTRLGLSGFGGGGENAPKRLLGLIGSLEIGAVF